MIDGTTGVRYARRCHPDDLWTSYFTSSKHVQKFREEHGEPDVIEVREVFPTDTLAREWEHKVLRRIGVVKSDRWLNKCDGKSQPPLFGEDNPFFGKVHTPEVLKKIGEASLGRRHSEEFKLTQSERRSGSGNHFYGKNRSGYNNPMFGKKHSDEAKEKQRKAKRLNPPIGEKNSMFGKKQPVQECPYCHIVCSKTNFIKWHGNNCKEKNI